MSRFCLNIPEMMMGELDLLLSKGLFTDKADAIREGIRDLLRKYDKGEKPI